ncbi:MAG: diaminopimelate dehydrogenase, partial [Candidatus Delongbacteria bacterium]|nr:diaminopimelate dehydrogenase [Candidatus Delongbacteria bacterium]
MEKKIRLGIVGYGNLGKGAELAIGKNPDMELVVIFTRRDPAEFKTTASNAVFKHIRDAESYVGQLDALLLCGGSATDLPEQGPLFASMFNTIDSFDTHAKIPEYFATMDEVARKSGKTAFISSGWDPGLFSVLRVLGESVLTDGHNYTFWGPGVSQGHSDAIRRIKG